MRAADWLSGLGHRFRSIHRARPRRRRADRRAPVAADIAHLEARRLLSAVVPIPKTNPRVPLSTIFWNGGPPLNQKYGLPNTPSPTEAGAEKTITITNDGPGMIYPFLRGQNTGVDPNSSAPGYYDPQDLMGHEFREYIGYTAPDGTEYLGLPKGASIKIVVPLVLWDGDNLYIATDGNGLTSAPIFKYDANASISVAKTDKIDGTQWVKKGANYPDGDTPLVMFYYSGTPLTLPDDAPAQLTEVTFRDEYLTHFIDDPAQTFPLVNYDVSYVNNLVAPVSMEASHVPITYQTHPLPAPPDYYGYGDFGWLATDRHTDTFGDAIDSFVHNKVVNSEDARIGKYFGGKGWPEYYNPDLNHHQIPSGANLFADSPMTTGKDVVHQSSYDANRWLLTSNGRAPIQAGGRGVGQQGFVNQDATNRIYLGNPTDTFVTDLKDMMEEGTLDVSYPGGPALSTVADYHPNPGGMPYVTLTSDIPVSGPSGQVYAFTRKAGDYAVTDITNLWYSWAQYYVEQYQNFEPETCQASLTFKGQYATNEITLAAPQPSLAVGMTVTAPSGVPAGTTILSIDGTHIYLSQIPADSAPASQSYTFSKPQPIPYQSETTPFQLKFDVDGTPNAVLFAGSVYAAMSAEAGVNPLPFSYLPDAMNLVSQVIQFYVYLPGYNRPDHTGSDLVGQVRDVVKSILRGVYNYNAVTDQSKWYPDPSTPPPGLLSGQDFNVFNLDPYVWFVHRVENMSAYGFSVDDDVANPTATGPLLGPDGQPNHYPNDLQIDFGDTKSLGEKTQWFPTTPWGTLTAMVKISVQQTGDYKGDSIITFDDPDKLKNLMIYNQINNPGPGQVGASISGQGIAPGTTLIFKGPNGGTNPQIVLSKKATSTDTPIQVTITGAPETGPALTKRSRR